MRTGFAGYKGLTASCAALLALAAVCLCAGRARAGGPGTSGAAFLNVGMGARAAALGDSGAAARGLEAAAWNPAGLAALGGAQVQFTRLDWLETITFDDVLIGAGTRAGGMALWVRRVKMDPLDGYSEWGAPEAEYDASDTLAAAAWGRAFGRWSAGAAVKYISSEIADASARTVAVDAGLQYALGERFIAGLAARNLGRGLKFDQARDPLPAAARLGLAWAAVKEAAGTVTLFLDAEKPRDRRAEYYAGLEYAPARLGPMQLALRGGYRTRIDGLDPANGFAVGAGLSFGAFSVGYAYVPYGALGVTNRFSAGWRFACDCESGK